MQGQAAKRRPALDIMYKYEHTTMRNLLEKKD